MALKKTIILISLAFFWTKAMAQISFEEGYFINNSGIKTACLINNISWQSNPTQFVYKGSENEEKRTATLETVKEFGIIGHSKYIRYDVDIDRSSEITANLSTDRNPTFHQEKLFLKVLVEGEASLLMYRDQNLRRYFYKKDSTDVEQLVYKLYTSYTKNNANNMLARRKYIKKNLRYQQQLWTDLKCSNITLKEIERINYSKSDLTKFFVKYNTCKKSTSILPHETQNKDVTVYKKTNKGRFVNLSIKPRLNNASAIINKTNTNETTSIYKNENVFGVGFEAEFILPFNNNEWSIFIEPESNIKGSTRLPIGARYTANLNSNSSLYFNGSYSILLPEIAGGIGYKYDKFIIEARYGKAKGKTSYIFRRTDYTNFALMVGYNFF